MVSLFGINCKLINLQFRIYAIFFLSQTKNMHEAFLASHSCTFGLRIWLLPKRRLRCFVNNTASAGEYAKDLLQSFVYF